MNLTLRRDGGRRNKKLGLGIFFFFFLYHTKHHHMILRVVKQHSRKHVQNDYGKKERKRFGSFSFSFLRMAHLCF